jgi:acyl carrier protein
MTEPQIKDVLLQALGRIAPEADLAALDPEIPLRDQLDLDSMDFLYFLTEISEKTGVEIPEADYGRVASLKECVAYVQARG